MRLKNCRAANFSYSSRTVLPLTDPEKLLICFQEKLQSLFHQLFCPPNRLALVSIHWSVLQECVYQTRIGLQKVDHLKQRNLEDGIVLTNKRFLTMLSMNGKSALEHAVELIAGILNISFEEQPLAQINFLSFTCWKLQFSLLKFECA